MNPQPHVIQLHTTITSNGVIQLKYLKKNNKKYKKKWSNDDLK
jgi:hypothetical protein